MTRAFTLLETIIALGIFAGAALGLLTLMAVAAREVSHTEERLSALGLTDAVKLALDDAARQRGFDAVVMGGGDPRSSGDAAVRFTAGRGGTRVSPVGSQADEFFGIEVRRMSDSLAFDPAAEFAPLSITVSWPYRANPASASITPARDRRLVTFPVVINR